ncbi:Gfo/Idh/MocA family oxidoreductase [Alkalibacter rhizosphaerae]|uniref:Gfo/Idh/MocA family oxidoreductase n=1 Tax=Alkalibacter rhizosphaerae TaxID=2815577 RepID=A0A974XI74_9FIRM|nr:Gfo/Idh/MocA family oxidoreductase [Alkalibacter rhizosphaerae]QSX09210.1 Gfo/Idh/MocA family oxidoreductase [Alkalibacter rhizosphaerae]
MKEVNWGLIGCGQVTEVKSGPGLYKSENSNLVAVYDNTYERAQDYGKRHHVKKVYEKVEDLLQDSEIDIIYIATPPKFHKEYAIACLNHGKIPYVEKPVAMNHDECLEIEALSKEKGIPVYVAFYRRGMEKFLRIKELLDQKILGDIRYLYVTQIMKPEETDLDPERLPWRLIPEISGGGKFLDMAVHVLDCLEFFFGKMESMSGIVENKGGLYRADDTVVATFRFQNGIVGSGTWCYVADHEENRVEIVGEKGRILYDGLSAKRFTLILDGQEEVIEFEEPEHVAMPFQQSVVNELIGKEKSNANFEEAINLVRMTDMLLSEYNKQVMKNVEN